MQTRSLALLALLLAAPAAAAPVAGTCTVSAPTDMVSIAKGGAITINFPIVPPVGFQFPVTIDPAAGTFVFDRTGWPDHYSYVTVGVVHGFLTLPQNTVTGTIDGAGNVALPNFDFTTSTDYCGTGPNECSFDATTTLTSGFSYASLSGTSYFTKGTPLDFTTGKLELQGAVPWPGAPGGGSVTGLGITCTIAPIPTGLPAPLSVAPKGKIKMGPALPAEPPTDPATKVPGDTITLKTLLKKGGTPLDPHGDGWIELADGTGTQLALLYVAQSAFKGKGKTLVATDSGGSVIQVLNGWKKDGSVSATLGGKLVLKGTKKGIAVTLQETGLDLGGFTGGVRTTIQVGAQRASAAVTVAGSGVKRKFH